MADIDAGTQTAVPPESLVRLTHVIYGLHAFSAVMGMLGPAFIVTAFLTGWPSIIAVIINYVKRDDARGTFLDSHFGWQIRTFWYAVLWVLVMVVLILTFFGIPLAWLMGVIVGIWVLYRIARGWITLNDGRAMPA
jgi:uncharacterized membrane protein